MCSSYFFSHIFPFPLIFLTCFFSSYFSHTYFLSLSQGQESERRKRENLIKEKRNSVRKKNGMDRFEDVYMDKNVTDERLLIRLLNTVLENEEEDKFIFFYHIIQLILKKDKEIRPKITKFIKDINKCEKLSFPDFAKKVKDVQEEDCFSLFTMCFLRSIFEDKFKDKIAFTISKAAIEMASGEDEWLIFLEYIDYVNLIC
jgi:hypothetical protein